MKRQLTWLSDAEWARIEPLLPRGRKGAHRVDDRRVISGIVHMLKSGARWRDCPPEYGPYTTVYNHFNRLEPARYLAGHVRGPDRAQRRMGNGRHRRHPHQGAPLGGRRKRGAFAQAIGISRGGRTSRLHALTDVRGRPRLLMLSSGNINDMTVAGSLIKAANGRFDRLIADRGYDTNAIRAAITAQGAEAVIPTTASRKAPVAYDRATYKARNLVERLWCRLKDWRRIATRYDKLARNFLAGAQIAAVIIYRCN